MAEEVKTKRNRKAWSGKAMLELVHVFEKGGWPAVEAKYEKADHASAKRKLQSLELIERAPARMPIVLSAAAEKHVTSIMAQIAKSIAGSSKDDKPNMLRRLSADLRKLAKDTFSPEKAA